MFEKKPFIISDAFALGIAAILWGLDGVVLTPRLYNLPPLLWFYIARHPFFIDEPFLFQGVQAAAGIR